MFQDVVIKGLHRCMPRDFARPLLSMHSSILYVLVALTSAYGSTIGPVGDVHLTNQQVSPDGFSRSAIVINGAFPAPLINGYMVSELFQLNVIDGLTDTSMPRASSIHWHGIFQENSNWADGVSFVTQCPILPGNAFLYEFSTLQSGTFWYHSHFALQYCDGLRGPFVIYDPFDPLAYLYDVDDETTVITLADWNHFTTNNLPAVPNFSSVLINGLGRFLGGPLSPLAVISVKHGLRYRFRLVSLSCDPSFTFKIDGHNMTIIEADGISQRPVTVDSLQIFAGQRYSFVLDANQKVDNYWIRAIPDYVNSGFQNNTNSAILRYVGASEADPTTVTRNGTNLLNETDLHPLIPVPVPGAHHVGGADVSINLEIGVDFSDPTAPKYTLGGSSFLPPTSPALLQILSGASLAPDLLPSGSYYALPPNKVIEISIPGGSDGGAPHPFHLHGHAFHVVRSAGSTEYNWNDPVIRDTVSTGTATAGDNVTFRFVTDNAGPWFLHCHIDYHLDIGLAVVLVEDIKTTQHEYVPEAWDRLCPIYDAANGTQLA
ncbi:multicopper redoxase [Mycena maculata]|uniref:Multicopper redoxase n=1 Tax=Mycena maculata TaxID=230809 RepID=A0AAD7J6D4_9AGAR|nr:multicopper redoxase [Mycena maculata]